MWLHYLVLRDYQNLISYAWRWLTQEVLWTGPLWLPIGLHWILRISLSSFITSECSWLVSGLSYRGSFYTSLHIFYDLVSCVRWVSSLENNFILLKMFVKVFVLISYCTQGTSFISVLIHSSKLKNWEISPSPWKKLGSWTISFVKTFISHLSMLFVPSYCEHVLSWETVNSNSFMNFALVLDGHYVILSEVQSHMSLSAHATIIIGLIKLNICWHMTIQ